MRAKRLLAVGAAVAAIAIAPDGAVTAAQQPDRTSVAIVAHRGSSATAPENTLAAFRLGIAQGSDLIESDVQRSKDGALVLMHDTTLARTTDVEQVFPARAPWRVADFTLAEIKQLDAGSWKSADYAGERVPTLAEMIRVVRRSRSGILMEIKAPHLYPGIEQEVAAEFDRHPGYVTSAVASGRLVVQSFDWESMRRYKALEPDVPVGLLGTPSEAQLPELAEWADQVNPYFRSFDARYVARAHQLGLEVLAWTVDAEGDMHAVLDRGVDGVITNRPDALRTVLRDRHSRAA